MTMSFYRNRVYPHVVSVLGNREPIHKIRKEIVPLAQGTVLEVGVGPGVNFAYYDPAKIDKVYALEPNQVMMGKADKQRRRTKLNVEFLGLPGEQIPLPESSVDTVVSTFTLCTIPGVVEAIRGIARVLRPQGQFLFFPSQRTISSWQNKIYRTHQALHALLKPAEAVCFVDYRVNGNPFATECPADGFAIHRKENYPDIWHHLF
jgi:ubiquinone/menaquinone biosynthesis C-methylase UbiE